MKHFSPAEYVIHVMGGVRATGRAIGRSATAVGKWRQSRRRGGTSGRIPPKVQGLLLAYAHTHAMDIVASDFKFGRKVHIPRKKTWE